MKFDRINERVDITWAPIIASRSKKGIIKIINKNIIPTMPPILLTYIPFNEVIIEIIESNKIFAAYNASIKDNRLGGYQIISNENQLSEIGYEVYDQSWEYRSIEGSKAIVIVDLITIITKKA